ncbi:DUF5996 family protein [Tsuneonella sp. HG222]
MSDWPKLDFAQDEGTIESLHLLLQLIGKLPTRLHPWVNHGWHVALRMTPRGAITRSIPAGGRHFAAELDFLAGAIRVTCDTGAAEELSVAGKTIAAVHAELSALLVSMGLPAPLWGGPNELPDPLPFAGDDRPRECDPDAAIRLHRAFLSADRVFNEFRSLYSGKSSPSHLFWGSFDLAVTRFSGRPAPAHPGGIPNLPDPVTREAYSAEEISAGFWPGNGGFGQAAFYAYAYPAPEGLSEGPVAPDGAYWDEGLGEFVLPYEVVRRSPDPDAALRSFLESTYAAGAKRLDWPPDLARAEPATFGRPPPL